jgi:MFS transporter, DHA2 family, multidrug resistance protein
MISKAYATGQINMFIAQNPCNRGFYWPGSFFLLCALIRRLRPSNPLALPYLWKRNTILLGSLLFWFRFTLCTTIILVPEALAIRGLESDQIGPAIIWSALPLLPVAFTAALLLLRKVDPRLLFATGLASTAFAAWLNSQYSSAWAAENFYRTELLTGVGQAFAFIGLVGCIVLQAIFTGGLAKPERALTFSAFLCRPFVWRDSGCHLHGPLHCPARTAPLQSFRASRHRR